MTETRISTHWDDCWQVHPDCAAVLFKDLIENVRAYLKRWGVMDDPQHRHSCDWNLYPEQRPDPDLCNLGCLDDPEGVAASRAYVAEQPNGGDADG